MHGSVTKFTRGVKILPAFEELKIFAGNSNEALAKNICGYLGTNLGRLEAFKFPNDNSFVRILENIRERDVFLVQSLNYPVNDNVMELLIMIDAAKRASAGRITAVIPYYGYGRTDKKDQPRVPITARLIADLISVAGADRVLTLDLHAAQIQGFFNIPLDELTSVPILARHYLDMKLENPVVVAVDYGIGKRARLVAEFLDAPLAIVEKRRTSNDSRSELLNIIGEVKGKTAILVDDEIDTGGSLINAAGALLDEGVTKVYACCTHGVLSGEASTRIENGPLEELILTDSIALPVEKLNQKIAIISIADILGEAIHRIHHGLSVGAMFENS